MTFPEQYAAAVRYSRDHGGLDAAVMEAFRMKASENPDDHLTHLVMADYVEEQGAPGVAHILRETAGNTDAGFRSPASPSSFAAKSPLKLSGHGINPAWGEPGVILYLDHGNMKPGAGKQFRHQLSVTPSVAKEIMDAVPDDFPGKTDTMEALHRSFEHHGNGIPRPGAV